MIVYKENSSIFDTECEYIVNPVNCIGGLHSNIDIQYMEHFPEMYEDYQNKCKHGNIRIGELTTYKCKDKSIINFPIKSHWIYQSKYGFIECGLQRFVDTYKEINIKSIAFPILNYGLDKDVILNMMNRYLSKCKDIIIEIYL